MTKKGKNSRYLSLKNLEIDWETNESTQIQKMFLLANIHVYDYDEEVSVPEVFQTLFKFTEEDVLDL